MEAVFLIAIDKLGRFFFICLIAGLITPQAFLFFAHKSKRTRLMVIFFYTFLGMSVTVCGEKAIEASIGGRWFLALAPLAALVVWLVMLRRPSSSGGEGGHDVFTFCAQRWHKITSKYT